LLFYVLNHILSSNLSFLGFFIRINISFCLWLFLVIIIRIQCQRLIRTFFHLTSVSSLSLSFIYKIIAIFSISQFSVISLMFGNTSIRIFWAALLALTFFAYTIRMANHEVVGSDVLLLLRALRVLACEELVFIALHIVLLINYKLFG